MELLVVIAIIAVLIGLLLPAVQSVRTAAQTTKCASNMRQVGIGITLYAEAHRGAMPLSTHDLTHEEEEESWIYTVAPFVEAVNEIRICPTDPNGPDRLQANMTSYILNSYVCIPGDTGAITNLNKLAERSKTYVAFEASNSIGTSHADHTHSINWFKDPTSLPLSVRGKRTWTRIRLDVQTDRHGTGSHAVFADGRVELLEESQIDQWVTDNFNFPRPLVR